MLIKGFVIFLLAGTLSGLSLSNRNLNSLLSYLSSVENKLPKKPVVLLLSSDTLARNLEHDDSLEDSNEDRDDGLLLGKVDLREGELGDNDSFDDLSGHQKHVLRAALRRRCNEVNKCQKKCPEKPKKKKFKCVTQCTEELDEENLCEDPEPPCKKSSCGRTMPPSWLL